VRREDVDTSPFAFHVLRLTFYVSRFTFHSHLNLRGVLGGLAGLPELPGLPVNTWTCQMTSAGVWPAGLKSGGTRQLDPFVQKGAIAPGDPGVCRVTTYHWSLASVPTAVQVNKISRSEVTTAASAGIRSAGAPNGRPGVGVGDGETSAVGAGVGVTSLSGT